MDQKIDEVEEHKREARVLKCINGFRILRRKWDLKQLYDFSGHTEFARILGT